MTTHTIDKIHQILIADGLELPERLPARFQLNVDHLRHFYPNAEYRLWSGRALREFIGENFEPAVLDAFDTIKPYSFKADLARYCLLYIHGGLYADVAICLLNEWKIPTEYGLATFSDVPSGHWLAIQCGLIWAAPKRAEFKIAIDLIVENCRLHYYGRNALCPTGPELLGKAFVLALARQPHQSMGADHWIGISVDVTPQHFTNLHYIDPRSNLIARRAKTIDGDIKHLGFDGSNNYNDIWNSRRIYGETRSVWAFDSRGIHLSDTSARTSTGIRPASGHVGLATYGPYCNLPADRYRIVIRFSRDVTFSRIAIDICADAGEKIIGVWNFSHTDLADDKTIMIKIQTDHELVKAEFRFYVDGDFVGELLAIECERLASSSNS